jgi:hypothetical protein
MSEELVQKVSAMGNSIFERNADKFIPLSPEEVFVFSYIHGFKGAFKAYVVKDQNEVPEAYGGEPLQDMPNDMLPIVISSAEKEFKKYLSRVKTMPPKDVYTTGYQSGFEGGWNIYSDEGLEEKDIYHTMKYYQADFDRLQ